MMGIGNRIQWIYVVNVCASPNLICRDNYIYR